MFKSFKRYPTTNTIDVKDEACDCVTEACDPICLDLKVFELIVSII